MIRQKSSIPIFLIIIFTITITLSCTSGFLTASNLLPNVSPNMEEASFWINKIRDPGRLLLTPEGIQKMNEENLKRQDLLLCSVKDLKEEWTREEILNLLNEDWKGFGRTGEARYGRYGYPLEDAFWNGLKKNLNTEALKERNQLLLGLIGKRTDIRVFPTEELSIGTPVNYEFDRFQHSSVSPGSLVGIYHFSQDKLWAYVQTSFIRGWVRTVDLAMAKDRREVSEYGEIKERLVITGNFVTVFGDPLFQKPILLTQMGSSFPMLHIPGQNKMANQSYLIKIPFRESDGRLTFRIGYIPPDEDVHLDFLPYTQGNLARQAFKMLHQPYGWGEMFGARDCSRFIMDIFNTFGILMPRNSKLQAMVGISLGLLEEKSIKERKKVLDRAIPLATLLRLPGHIMLYLGKHNGKYYVIHNIWGIQKWGWFGPKTEKIGKVVVSDLTLGKTGPHGSLLHRITEAQFIGCDAEVRNIFH